MNKKYKKASEAIDTLEEESGIGAVFAVLMIIIVLSIGIVELITWAVCMVTGIHFTFWLGLAVWILWSAVKYNIAVHRNDDD